MQSQTLNGDWLFRQRDTQEWLHGRVPGGVHTDLLLAGKIPDPFIGVNEKAVQWAAEKDWEYRRYFYPSAQILAQPKVYLVCNGLDTLADVRLNGKILGRANNMFHAWEWEVKNLLREGENSLDILFRSPVTYTRQRQRINPMSDLNMGLRGGSQMRKAPSHFGWDWGPRLACIGIWKDIQLEGRAKSRLDDVYFEQQHEDGMVMLTARVKCSLDEPHPSLTPPRDAVRTLRLRVTASDRQVWLADAPARTIQTIPLKITNPQLWWPNGLGAQPLYQVEVELLEEDRALQETRVIDARSFNLGLRTIELRQTADGAPDSNQASFQFVVNGRPIFAKGANWIPADSFPARVSAQQLEHLLRSAMETNQNMLRVWGGGYYESDLFYDLCDRFGILVWQDFPFACAAYPLDDPVYLDSVCREASENIRRLRHHASLALWCGNNEVEWLAVSRGWNKKRPELMEAHAQFFYHRLPELTAAEDPQRAYWPGSPSSNDPFSEPNSEQRGDAHLWKVYHYFKQPDYYRQQNPRFASEFGFQSLPAIETIHEFAPPNAQRLNSKEIECHQRAIAGNPKLLWYLSRRFRLPRAFEHFAYLSQVFQAEAMRTAVEHWRRHPEHTSGALYWQLNDCWPVISWSSIDYYGRWKALQYAARRFFAPVLLSVAEDRANTARKADLWVTNDHAAAFNGNLRWTLETVEGEMLEGGQQTVHVEGGSAANVLKLDFSQPKSPLRWNKTVLTAELWQGEERLSLVAVPFVLEKQMAFSDPELNAVVEEENERLLIHVSAKRLARFIEIKLDGADLVFSDNYFDLPAGRSIVIVCALPEGWSLEQAQAALKIRSLETIRPCDSNLLTNLKGSLALIETLSRTLVALAGQR